jgi:pilus assembly protein FimV
MVRMLLKSLLSLSLIAPLSAFALGLGDVHLHSALGERLQADIDLLSVNQAEAGDINVSLASQETFDKVGLERSAILMFLKFAVVQGSAGSYSVNVTSREPINEPFLDFLVEVEWKSGRVLREYTLLLDPPSSQRETAPAVSSPSAAATTTSSIPTSTPSAQSATQAAKEARTGVSSVSSTSMAPAAGMMPPSSVATGGIVYGPVKVNDTLWRIAEQLRPSSDISVQQMMVALVKANPYAFFDNNINRLKRGYVLRIDDPSLLTASSKAEAAREVTRQTRAWQDYRESVAARAKQRPAAASAVEATPGVAAAGMSEPKLTLVSPEGKGADSATPSGSAEGKSAESVSEELMLALEGSAAQRKENEALKQRLEALDSQLQDMEKIISLKDADLAALQQQLRAQGKDIDMPSEQQPAATALPPAESAGLVVKPEEKPAEVVIAEVKPVIAEMTAPEVKSEVKPEPVVEKPVAKKPKPKVAPMPVEEPDLLETLLADPMMLGIGGGALIFVLILLGLIIKRRRKGGFQESILNGGTSSMMKVNDEQGSETSFLSDLAISGMGPGGMHTDEGEVDPLTEADVFMAYGRNQQAEEVLNKAREKLPGRADIAAKLLEVYYNSKDSAKFEALAEEAVGSLQDDDELWGSVLAMGHELCPENILFEAGAGAELPAAAESAASSVMDIGLDMDELTAEMEGEGSGGMDFDLGLDFSDLDDKSEASDETALDIDLGFDEPMVKDTESTSIIEESSDLDMDLGALDLESAAEESVSDADTLDFDLDLGGADEVAAESDEGGMDFDLDLGELSTEEASLSADAEKPGLDLDMGDFDLADLESAETLETATEATGGLDLEMALDDFGDLGDLDDLGDLGELDSGEDEITTKLDLAQAYAEMGDAEGARSMLEEVIVVGSAEQKQQAQALIDKL